jgi:hypothetical protein
MVSMTDLAAFARQSVYSDPGRHARVLAVVPSDIETICETSRNVIAHYRAELADILPEERRDEIDSRWLEVILDIDQQRHQLPLTHDRPITGRVAGCCSVRTYVFFELAHRYGDELLLWDSWGATEAEGPEIDALTDELARLLVAADGGDDGAESELATRYTHDNRLRPGSEVTTYSPYGDPPRTTSLHPTGPPATPQGGAPESHSAVHTRSSSITPTARSRCR